MDELDYLEGLRQCSRTKAALKSDHPPLDRFWHKHYSAPRYLLRNIAIRWSLDRKGNKNLDGLIKEVEKHHGDDPGTWPGFLAHRLVVGGHADRAERGFTGDWIIYGEHEGQNYYLDLASHKEGHHSKRLFAKLRNSSG